MITCGYLDKKFNIILFHVRVNLSQCPRKVRISLRIYNIAKLILIVWVILWRILYLKMDVKNKSYFLIDNMKFIIILIFLKKDIKWYNQLKRP